MTYRIFIHRLNAFIEADFDTASEAFNAAQHTLRPRLHFSIHLCQDGDMFAAVMNGVVGSPAK